MHPSEATVICPLCGYRRPQRPCGACADRVVTVGSGAALRPGRGFFAGDLLHGFLALFQAGLHLFNRPEFFGKLKLPVIANLVTFLVLFGASWFGLYSLFDWLLQTEWGFLDFLRTVLRVFAPLLLTLVALYLLAPAIIEAVTGPFLDPIADATEKAMAGTAVCAVDLGTWRNIWVGLRSTAQILVIQIGILIPCLLLSMLLPAVGFGIVFVITSALTALIWFEIPFLRRGQGLRQRLRVLRHNWARALGFGMAFQIGMIVPFFNVFLLTPAAAVATSMLYFHFEKAAPSS